MRERDKLSAKDLDYLFRLRKKFLAALGEKVPGAVHQIPLDPTQKDSQVAIREVALRGVEEMFEALQTLKNTKPHRQTDVSDFDREHFLEETVDAFNYFFNMLIYLGVSPNEFIEAYEKKHMTIMKRIEEGY
jgi:hypothetical protein